MAKKKNAPPTATSAPAPAAPSPAWFTYALCTLCGLLIGSTGTYLILSPNLQRGAAAAPATAAPTTAGADTHLSPAELTAGMPPAQAERTLGNFYYDHSDWVQAITHYESAIKQGSDDADIRTDLGNAYRFSNRPAEAIAQYQFAQKMNPSHEFSLFNEAGIYAEFLNQPQRAIEIWTQYLARFPQGANVPAARQLIAETQARMSGLLPTTATNPLGPIAPAGTKTGDDLLTRLKQISEEKPGKP